MFSQISSMCFSRRHFLASSAAAVTALSMGALSRRAQAQTVASGRRFLFVTADGGWDPLCVFAPMYDATSIDMEAESQRMQIGNLSLVDHPGRPAVRRFFERYGSQSLVFNGLSVRSVNHETCMAVALTGSTSDTRPDWATLLAADARSTYDLPHVVFSGPVFTGPHNVLVSRAQGDLARLIDGRLYADSEPAVEPLSSPAARMVDRFLERRSQGLLAGGAVPESGARQLRDLAESNARARRLSDARYEINLQSGFTPAAQARTAVDTLAKGLCRCASVATGGWDTHEDNSEQIGLFEGLFSGLEEIMSLLARTMGPEGRPLAEDTVVVVVSEMSRTPAYNETRGRDHWPYTTAMIVGPGVTGDRMVGQYDDGFLGLGVDLATGELDRSKAGIAAEDFGATLLALGDVDPQSVLPRARPITGVLR
ncbi:MAG: DUF1501 domain-containing protein [Bradymonadia bacterium]